MLLHVGFGATQEVDRLQKASLVGGTLAEAKILAISILDSDEGSGKKQGSCKTEPSPWNPYASYSNHSDCMDLY